MPIRRDVWIVHSVYFHDMALTADSRTSARIPEWDGIRGVAILLVVFYHYIYGTVPENAGGILAGVIKAVCFRWSWCGVDLFFVLSGFLIGGILMDQRESGNYFKTFYIRRFCRIVPLYFVWLILFLLLALAVSRTTSTVWLGTIFNREIPSFSRWGYFLFLQNFYISKAGAFGSPWLAATWVARGRRAILSTAAAGGMAHSLEEKIWRFCFSDRPGAGAENLVLFVSFRNFRLRAATVPRGCFVARSVCAPTSLGKPNWRARWGWNAKRAWLKVIFAILLLGMAGFDACVPCAGRRRKFFNSDSRW